ncbi:hypothetical protein SOVF_044130 [Spinacia oleracea]|nr:hypothetical protein SOVF_044130 [Spinacia oleracea]
MGGTSGHQGHTDEGDSLEDMMDQLHERVDEDPQVLEELLTDSEKPLYKDSKHSKLPATVKLYNVKEKDDKSTMQNDGVSLEAEAMHFPSAKDNRPVYSKMQYYGVIDEIFGASSASATPAENSNYYLLSLHLCLADLKLLKLLHSLCNLQWTFDAFKISTERLNLNGATVNVNRGAVALGYLSELQVPCVWLLY